MTADAARYVLAAQHLLLRRSGAASPLGARSHNGIWFARGDPSWGDSLGKGRGRGAGAPEWQRCCWLSNVTVTASVPVAYQRHACTLDHIARLFGVDWSTLRAAVRLLSAGEPACVVEDVLAVMLMRQRLDPRGRLPEARAVRRITQAVRLARDPTRSGTATP